MPINRLGAGGGCGCPIHAAASHEWAIARSAIRSCSFPLVSHLAKRRRTFRSDYCVHQWRLRTDPNYLRGD
ncbi:MAG TPA: hypothetical protein VNY74_12785 [Edaphobacter sp.]|nr:hypothetical protein [Edaphobacter sp.]